MKITKFSVTILILIIVIGVFVGKINYLISVNFDDLEDQTQFKTRDLKENVGKDLVMGDSPDHLLWFMQVSDLHISIFHDPGRISDFKEFCESTISAIKPSVVLASGDLTDAKQEDNIGSRQYSEEWKSYRNILEECKSIKDTVYLDVRGNHDNFDVPGSDSERNLYKNYSWHGEPKSYVQSVRDGAGAVYKFVAVDACPDQGLRRPFNFIGVFSDNDVRELANLVAAAPAPNYTLWFGHYPTSCILGHQSQVRKMIGSEKSSLVYLCGHLHTLGGMLKHMYTMQKQGFLELELADWKDNRMYRLAAIDHGLFSFIDVKHNDWPVILITNPKDALFASPIREPLHLMLESTHIRVMVFSLSPVGSVNVKIDDGEWMNCKHINGPLYTVAWQPTLYIVGLHDINVQVDLADGTSKVTGHQFSLDGSRPSFHIMSRIFLMSNISSIFQLLFGFSVMGSVLPLCLLRYFNTQIKCGKLASRKLKRLYQTDWLRRLWIVANIDRFFYPLVLYPIYITLGPWSIGELIEGYVGVLFAWGTFINGVYLPGAFTYAYGFIQLVLFQYPVILVLSCKVESRLHRSCRVNNKVLRLFWGAISELPFTVLLTSQVVMAYLFWLSYGSMALVLGPFRTTPILLILYLWLSLHSIPVTHIRQAFYALSLKDRPGAGRADTPQGHNSASL